MIRISSQQIFSGGINRMQDLNVSLNDTQKQLSTGKRVNKPSDDPVAAARILKLDQEVGRIETYQRNVSLAENRLQKEESTLSSMVDVIQRVRELTVQAGNGSLSANDRQSISAELKERLGQLGSLANTRDASGEYLFSGFQGDTPAFGKNISGDWVYQGDEGQRSLEIDDGVTVPISDHGKKLFVDVASAGPTFFAEASASNSSGARVSTGAVLDPDLVAGLAPENLVVSVEQDPGDPSALVYSITEQNSGNPVVTDVPYVSGETIRVEGMQFEITGADAGDDFFIKTSNKQSVFSSIEKLIYGLDTMAKQSEAAKVTDFAPDTGDVLSFQVGEDTVDLTFEAGDGPAELVAAINGSTDGALEGIEAELVSGEVVITSGSKDFRIDASGWAGGDLRVAGARYDDISITAGTPDPGFSDSAGFSSSQKAYDELIGQSLTNMDNAQEAIVRTQTDIGGRMNALESTGEFLENSALYSKDIRSQLQDVDYAEAISNLSFQSFVLQAAQQSFAQTSQLSLFDRL